ncbi:MAG: phosphatase PAP2 family protein [Deltaproteobacteria bacterium]|nr:phosphatase PAP2 family protein [Deltaproteobacteria bacterium]
MSTRDRIIKGLLFLAILIYYVGGYFLIGFATAHRSGIHRIALPYESQIPFVPEMIFAYLLIYAFTASAYVGIDDLAFFKKVVKSFFLCVSFHFIFFLVFPVEYTLRPSLDYGGSWLNKLIVFYYWLDPVYNCFPSLHVSNVFLVSFFFERYRKGLGKIFFPFAWLVAVSVVFVKQHYILDVVSGIFVGWLCYRIVFKPISLTKGVRIFQAPRSAP